LPERGPTLLPSSCSSQLTKVGHKQCFTSLLLPTPRFKNLSGHCKTSRGYFLPFLRGSKSFEFFPFLSSWLPSFSPPLLHPGRTPRIGPRNPPGFFLATRRRNQECSYILPIAQSVISPPLNMSAYSFNTKGLSSLLLSLACE